MDNHQCHCGKKAIGLISDEGWLCKNCFDEKLGKIKVCEKVYHPAALY